MKISKIFAGMSAMAIAASMLTMVSASAAEAAYTGSKTMTGNDSWWAQETVTVSDLIGDVDPETVTEIKFTADSEFIFAYNSTEVTGTNEDGTDNFWKQADKSTELTIAGSDIDWVDGNYYAALILNSNADTTATISWEVYTDGETPAPVDEIPADAIYAGGGSSWNGVEYESLKDVKFTAWDGIWFQVGVEKEGFVADTSNAKVVVKLTADEASVAGEDGTFADAIRYVDTTDATKYSVKQEDGKTEYVLEISYDDYVAAIKDVKGEDTTQVWENGFGSNMQFGAAGTVTAYVTGVTYEEVKGVELPEYVYAYGDLEDNGNVRIELYNQWGPSGNDADKAEALKAIYDQLKVTDTLDVTFTISGLDALNKDINANAHMTFFDGGMTWATWNEEKDLPPISTNATITGDGTYTVSIKKNPEATTDATGATVFAVDIDGLWTALGLENMKDLELTAAEKSQILADLGVTISDVKIVADGVQFLPAEGDKPDPTPVDSSESVADSTSESTTDSTTSSKASSSSKAASNNTTTNPNTGAAALAAVGVALAGAAVVASKKRK